MPSNNTGPSRNRANKPEKNQVAKEVKKRILSMQQTTKEPFFWRYKKTLAIILFIVLLLIVFAMVFFRNTGTQERIFLTSEEKLPRPKETKNSKVRNRQPKPTVHLPVCSKQSQNVIEEEMSRRIKSCLDKCNLPVNFNNLEVLNNLPSQEKQSFIVNMLNTRLSFPQFKELLDTLDAEREMDSAHLLSAAPFGRAVFAYLREHYNLDINAIMLGFKEYKSSVLHEAVVYENWDKCETVLELFGDQIDFSYQDIFGNTAAILAIKMQRPELAMKIFEMNRLKDAAQASQLPSIMDIHGRTALHYAALFGHQDLFYFLIELGCDWHVTDVLGNSPLDLLNDTKENKQLIVDTTTQIAYCVERAENAPRNHLGACVDSEKRIEYRPYIPWLYQWMLGVTSYYTQGAAAGSLDVIANRQNQDKIRSSLFANYFEPGIKEAVGGLPLLSPKRIFDLILENRESLRASLIKERPQSVYMEMHIPHVS